MIPQESEGKEIAILGYGGSISEFVMSRINSREYDEVWGINGIGAIFPVTRTFMMDPASRFIDGGKAGKQTGLARDLFFNTANLGPIYSCVLDDRVPEIVQYPLEDVIRETGICYFNNTVAYAVAFAVAAKVSKINFYGIDFTYRSNVSMAEAGRACVEFWCSQAISRGVKIEVASSSSLLDTNVPEAEKLYGYHRLDDPLVQKVENGSLSVTRKSDLLPPEPLDAHESVLIGREDIKGVTYESDS